MVVFHHKKFVFCLAFTMVDPPLGSYFQNRSCFLSKESVQVFFHSLFYLG